MLTMFTLWDHVTAWKPTSHQHTEHTCMTSHSEGQQVASLSLHLDYFAHLQHEPCCPVFAPNHQLPLLPLAPESCILTPDALNFFMTSAA